LITCQSGELRAYNPFFGIKPLGAKKVLIDRSFGTVANQIDNILKTGVFLPDICAN